MWPDMQTVAEQFEARVSVVMAEEASDSRYCLSAHMGPSQLSSVIYRVCVEACIAVKHEIRMVYRCLFNEVL